MTLRTYPLTLKQANDFVEAFHRHHKKCTSHRFSLAAVKDGWVVGVVVVGRPVSYVYHHYLVCEVYRLCTLGDKNVCSFLYGAAARIAKEMGFHRIQTYTLDTESGDSLRAAGWTYDGIRQSKPWTQRDDGFQRHNKHPTGPKKLWFREFGPLPKEPTLPTLEAMLK